jgi:hypothetical protein
VDEWPLGQDEISFGSPDELFAALLNLGNSHLLYRGQRSFDWPLTCSLARHMHAQAEAGGPFPPDVIESMVDNQLFRHHVVTMETEFLREFMERAEQFGIQGLPSRSDRLGWWELMQHHGAPTRLLDWTRSPFVALWFAMQSASAGGEDAALWIFNSYNSHINHLDTMQQVEADNNAAFLDHREWQNQLAVGAIAKSSFVPLVISPRMTLARAAAQQSSLTLIPNVEMPKNFTQLVISTIATKVRIPFDWRERILRVCDSLGINRLELFRDLDSLGGVVTEALRTNQPITIRAKLRDAQGKVAAP